MFLSLNNKWHHHKCRLFPQWHIPHNKGAHSSRGRPTNILPVWYKSHTVLLLLTAAIAVVPLLLTWHSSRGAWGCVWVHKSVCPDYCPQWKPFSDFFNSMWNGRERERTRNVWDKCREEGRRCVLKLQLLYLFCPLLFLTYWSESCPPVLTDKRPMFRT